MTCDGCSKKATHFVEGKPHCLEHMLDALCSVPVEVIDIESWEAKQREQRVSEVA